MYLRNAASPGWFSREESMERQWENHVVGSEGTDFVGRHRCCSVLLFALSYREDTEF